jgi:hypothetical protein
MLGGVAVKGHTKFYLGMEKSVKLVWLKAERRRQVQKERFFPSFQRTLCELIKMGKNQGDLDRHELDMAVRYARFIFVREELVGKSIFNCQGP